MQAVVLKQGKIKCQIIFHWVFQFASAKWISVCPLPLYLVLPWPPPPPPLPLSETAGLASLPGARPPVSAHAPTYQAHEHRHHPATALLALCRSLLDMTVLIWAEGTISEATQKPTASIGAVSLYPQLPLIDLIFLIWLGC